MSEHRFPLSDLFSPDRSNAGAFMVCQSNISIEIEDIAVQWAILELDPQSHRRGHIVVMEPFGRV